MKTKLKLYIYNDFCCDCTPGLAFAIASNETEARKMIDEKRGGPGLVWDWGHLEVRRIDHRVARCVSGGG